MFLQQLVVNQVKRANADPREFFCDEAANGSRTDDEDRASAAAVPCVDAVLGELGQSNVWMATRTGCG